MLFQVYCLPVLRTIVANPLALSNVTIVETTVSYERGMNPVAMVIVNHRKEIVRAGNRTTDPHAFPQNLHVFVVATGLGKIGREV